MRALRLVPDGCTLSAEALDVQLGRAERLAPAVSGLSRSDDALRVSFASDVDGSVVDELVETERGCCSFVDIGYDGHARVLRVESSDPRGVEVVRRLGACLAGEGR